jgi:hypothetical protein
LSRAVFAECLTLGKAVFAECLAVPSVLYSVNKLFTERRTLPSAALSKVFFAECGARQSLLCRVPDKNHSAKPPALGKGPNSGSELLLTEAEWKARKKKSTIGKCFNCGNRGHFAQDCRKKKEKEALLARADEEATLP